MDSFVKRGSQLESSAQEKIETEVNQPEAQTSVVDDIQFEEMFDADKIQNELKASLGLEVTSEDITVEFVETKDAGDVAVVSSDTESGEAAEVVDSPDISEVPFDASILENEIKKVMDAPVKFDPNSKKYVVYVDSDNIEFMESLSIKDRREIINKILKEQNDFIIKRKIIEERTKFLKHALLATITFIVGFPVLFFCVNRAMEITIDNYNTAKQNFSQLYRSSGKIRATNPQD